MKNECMDFGEFKEKIMLAVEERLYAKVEETNINKNNGIVLQAMIVLEEGQCMSPTFYFEIRLPQSLWL